VSAFEIHAVNTAVIVGAGHGIGASLAKKILEFNQNVTVFATYRDASKNSELQSLKAVFPNRLQVYQVDPKAEHELEDFKTKISLSVKKVDLLINTVGFLQAGETAPERSLRDVSAKSLEQYFAVNSVPYLLIAKVFHSLFRHSGPSALVALSAKVGSIEDNSLGGWYGYRASKAALNMFVKGVSLEYNRRGCNSLVLSIHPGTTVTQLSEPFIEKTKYKLHTSDQTAENILKVIDGTSLEHTGSFYSWDGEKLPW